MSENRKPGDTPVVLCIMGQSIGILLDRIVAVVIAVLVAIIGLNLFISSFVSFTRKSQIRVRESWDAIFSFLDMIIGFLSQLIFKRRLTLPRVDFTKIQVKAWFSRRTVIGLVLVLAIIYLASGLTVVKPDEIGVRFRFGAIVNEHLDPGLHDVGVPDLLGHAGSGASGVYFLRLTGPDGTRLGRLLVTR